VSTIDRPLPPLNAGERTTLESWLEFHRATLARKCEGLDGHADLVRERIDGTTGV
jgi:hypothetical protein